MTREKCQRTWLAALVAGIALGAVGITLVACGPQEESSTTPALGAAAETAPQGAVGTTEGVRDCDVCPELVRVPEGEFMMGAPPGDDMATSQERPAHRVQITKPFLVGKREVTFTEWDACVAEQGCKHRPDDFGWGRDNRPVMLVGWDDVQEYLAWLGGKTGKPYRLLTEAEWEYAARAGTSSRYWWGDAVGAGNANCKDCGSEWDDRQTAPVGSFRPNAFGLYDTSGNVWEWVHDCWADNFKSTTSNAGAYESAEPCKQRVLRGGSWINKPPNLRSSARSWGAPDGQVNIVGFRVARDD